MIKIIEPKIKSDEITGKLTEIHGELIRNIQKLVISTSRKFLCIHTTPSKHQDHLNKIFEQCIEDCDDTGREISFDNHLSKLFNERVEDCDDEEKEFRGLLKAGVYEAYTIVLRNSMQIYCCFDPRGTTKLKDEAESSDFKEGGKAQ